MPPQQLALHSTVTRYIPVYGKNIQSRMSLAVLKRTEIVLGKLVLPAEMRCTGNKMARCQGNGS